MYTFVRVGEYGRRVTLPQIAESLVEYQVLRQQAPAAIVVHPEAAAEVANLLQQLDTNVQLVTNGGVRAWEFWLQDGAPGGLPA